MTEENDSSLESELILYKIPTRKNTIFTKTSENGEKYIEFNLHRDYQFENVLGIGGYGIVASASHKIYGEVAVKKAYICNNPDYSNQLNRMVLRELYLLKKLPSHPNIIKHLKFEKIPSSIKQSFDAVYITTELLETNLGRMINITTTTKKKKKNGDNNNNKKKKKKKVVNPDDEVTKILMETYEEKRKEYFYQILLSVKHLHDRNLIHRDLKPGNILLNRKGDIKLCDFGFTYSTSGIYFDMENYITTRPYRAPEILMNSGRHQKRGYSCSKAIDVWSLGVILVEMFLKKIIFLIPDEVPKQHKDQVQIEKIMNLIGPPKRLSQIKHYLPKQFQNIFKNIFPPSPKKKKKKKEDLSYDGISSSSSDSSDSSDSSSDSDSDLYFDDYSDSDDEDEDREIRKIEELLFMKGADEVCIDLVRKMMHWDPRRRITIDDALNHEYFYEIHMRIESALAGSPASPASPTSPTKITSLKNYFDISSYSSSSPQQSSNNDQQLTMMKKKKKKKIRLSPLKRRNILSTRQRTGSDHTQLFKILMKRRKEKEARESRLVEKRLRKNGGKNQHQEEEEEDDEEEDDDGKIHVPGSNPFSFDYEMDLGDRYKRIRNKIFAFVNTNSEFDIPPKYGNKMQMVKDQEKNE